MHNAFAMLTEVTERALAHTEKKELLLAGGVAASPILKNMLETMCRERKAKLFVPERSVLVDNGAMIAWLGLLAFQHGGSMTFKQTQIKPKQRTDQVKVNWL
jgi:tRNA A37 threonylcarbamoyltransferase TsaD